MYSERKKIQTQEHNSRKGDSACVREGECVQEWKSMQRGGRACARERKAERKRKGGGMSKRARKQKRKQEIEINNKE